MKNTLSYFLVICCLLKFTPQLTAQSSDLYVLDKKIEIPGNGGYDYVFIDQINRKLYISHGTAVDVIDLESEKICGKIEGMTGVHGIAIANDLGKGFISDGKANTVVAFDITTYNKLSTISITGKDPDAILYDPYSGWIYAFNGDSKNASVIDPKTLKQTGTVDLLGAPEFAVSDGEGIIYNNLEDKNMLNVIDSKAMKVIRQYSLSPCGGPTGLALDKANKRLFTVCRQNKGLSVIDISGGKVIATLPIGAGVDAVVYDPVTSLVMCSNGDGTASIFKLQSPDHYSLVQTLKTQYRAKTMALDNKTHKIFFSAAEFETGTRTIIPQTFHVLVYKLKSDN